MSGWDFACQDWDIRLRQGQSLLPALQLDEPEADRAAGIFGKLRLPDVPGRPALSDAAGSWQRDIVRAVFGSLDAEGRRQVPEVFALVPKKNSKTTGGAAIMVTALLMNRRPRAEFILVGPTQEVADLAFQQAAGMIDADPDGYLPKRFLVQEHIKTILDRRTKARLKVKTFDLKVMTGAKPAGVLVDELHLMSTMAFASRVIGQIRGGIIANPEAFLIFISTQSDQPPAGVFRSELQYARGVRDGRIKDGRMLPVLYEFPEAMQRSAEWQDPQHWRMVLPNLGKSITIDRLVADWNTAQEKGEEEERRWASQHLNVEIGLALHDDRWAGADYWEAAADTSITLESLIERCDVAVVGIDGGGLDDLFGLAVIGRDKVNRDWLLWTRAWAQPEVLERRRDTVQRLEDFVADGDLVVCERPTQDIEEIAGIVARLDKTGLLPEKSAVGVDLHGIASLLNELALNGIGEGKVIGIAQGYRLTGAVWSTERALKDGTLWHAGSRMMAWCVGNAKAEQRGNAVLITKQAAGKAKIDPLVAAFDAVMLMGRNPEPVRKPQYQMIFAGGGSHGPGIFTTRG